MIENIIVPTYNSSETALMLVEHLIEASNSGSYIKIIDSSSTDGSYLIWTEAGLDITKIEKADFDHGGTRNLGARLAREQGVDILVFMTQDALPANPAWLENLVAPLKTGEAAATFARQLPRPEASLLEQFSRYFNYPDTSRLRSEADIPKLGVKAFFFSNVCSAVRADAFWEVGGFPERTIMNEDMVLAAKLLRAGYKVKYVAEAEVVHSHDYTLKQQFRRNFDVGAFFSTAGPELEGAAVTGEGFKFVREQLRYVLRHRRPDLVPVVILEAAAKFTAFQLGKRQKLIPKNIKKQLSMHSYHWDKEQEETL